MRYTRGNIFSGTIAGTALQAIGTEWATEGLFKTLSVDIANGAGTTPLTDIQLWSRAGAGAALTPIIAGTTWGAAAGFVISPATTAPATLAAGTNCSVQLNIGAPSSLLFYGKTGAGTAVITVSVIGADT